MGEVVVSSGGGMEVEVDVVVGSEEEAEEKEKRKETEKKDGSSEVVRWEKFLPRMVLRVLLVEADDSTRQIIAALLRKCSYKVAAVPDGLMAWETLKGRPHNIDIILTEVELPSISGYSLLTLVMEHDVCKNIPVIMMSSHDSISMVLKCMLKGAADFLIKPVRRNELRNLWQHVWRRQTLNAGHILQNSPDAQHKIESQNNSASDHSSDCATSSHKRKECSDEGSDSLGLSQRLRSASNLSNTQKEKYKECVTLDKRSIIHKSNAGDLSTRLGPVDASQSEAYSPTALKVGEEITCGKITIQDESAKPENSRGNVNTSHSHNDELVESSGGAIDLIGTFDNGPKRTYGHMTMHDGSNKFDCTPQLELSLNRYFPNNLKNQGVEQGHALNHSNASAFSWYSSKTLQPLFPTSTSNCTKFEDEASKSPRRLSNQVCNINGVSKRPGANQNGSQEIVTTLVISQSGQAEVAYPNPQKPIPVSGVTVDNICNGNGHGFPPMYYTQTSLPQAWNSKLDGQREQSPFPSSTSVQREQSPFPSSTSVHSNPEIYDHEQNHRQSGETAINSVDQNMHQQNTMEVEKLRNCSPAVGQSRSSSMCNSVADHNNNNAYGSFSSRSHGNATFAAKSENAIVPDSSNDGSLFFQDESRGTDSHRTSRREAALTKFRLKRKDRCYEKKVRYQSRKRLAELRPRVKGQFVRQVQNDAPIADAND